MRALRFHPWRDFRSVTCVMPATRTDPASLRSEARLLTVAGLILLGIGFPATLVLTAQALSPHGISPILPLAVGAPPIVLGYIACHFASKRMVKAQSLEGRR
jgi:hypothetical protein